MRGENVVYYETSGSHEPTCLHRSLQSRSQSPRSYVERIARLSKNPQKNVQNSLHFITVGSSTQGKCIGRSLLNLVLCL